jgi:hypothetical protein
MNLIYTTLQISLNFFFLFFPSYVKKLKEVAKLDYVPNVEDILRSRAKTVGIVEQKFIHNKSLRKVLIF